MAKKLFDSPYGKGVALNFKVDQTPYLQMIKDNKAEAKAREAARKEKEQDLNNILKSITYDDKNVLERHRPNARAEYAATIDDIIKHNKSQDLGSLYKRIGDFNSTMRTYGDEKLAFDSYVTSAADGKHWASQDYINDVNNTEISDVDIVDRHSDVMQYNKESGTFSGVATNKKDPLAFVNKAMQGMSPMFYRGDDGKLKSTGRLSETGDYLFLQSKAEDPETFYNELAATWIQDPENIVHTKNALGLTAEEFMEAPIKHARELLDPIASPKMFSEVAKKEPTQKDSKGFSFGSGGAKSDNWEVNPISNIPVALTDEVGGSFSGYKIDFIKQSGQTEIQRNIELGKGSYMTEGGSKIHEIDDKATGLGKIIPATPAGLYVRDDKDGGQIWAAYETNYIPPKVKDMSKFETMGLYDPSSNQTKEQQFEMYKEVSSSDDQDVSRSEKRIVYVPIKSKAEEIELRTAMGMSQRDLDKLIDDLGGVKKQSSLTSGQQSAVDAFKSQYNRSPNQAELDRIIEKY